MAKYIYKGEGFRNYHGVVFVPGEPSEVPDHLVARLDSSHLFEAVDAPVKKKRGRPPKKAEPAPNAEA